jgi:hypothetical protein
MEESMMKRRILAMLLAVALACTLLPTAALAADPDPSVREKEINGVHYSFNATNKSWTVASYDNTGTKTINIPDKIESFPVVAIQAEAFMGKDVSSIVIPGTVTQIGKNAFANCKRLTSVFTLEGSTPVKIEENAFESCILLKSFYGKNVGELGAKAFSGCRALESAIIEKGPTKLNSEIFASCGVLARVYLGGIYDGSTVVGNKFFTGANALTAIHIGGSISETAKDLLGKTREIHEDTSLTFTVDTPSCENPAAVTITSSCDIRDANKVPCSFNNWKVDSANSIPALGHDIIYTTPPGEATCTTEGHTGAGKCSRCDHELVDTVTDMLGHDWTIKKDADGKDPEGIEITPPTCIAEGLKGFPSMCSRDGCTVETIDEDDIKSGNGENCVTAPIPTIAHTFTEELDADKDESWQQIKAPTCSEVGLKILLHGCATTDCEAVETLTNAHIAAHVKAWEEANKPTTRADTGTPPTEDVTKCDHDVETVPTVPHTHGTEFKVTTPDYSCEAGGEVDIEFTCTVCNQEGCTDTVELPKGSHSYEEKVITESEASCGVDGIKVVQKVCTICGHKLEPETITTPSTPHKPLAGSEKKDEEKSKDPTCTESGLKAYTAQCETCGKDYYIEEVLPALGHDPGDLDESSRVETKAPTCTEEGEETYTSTCKRCDVKTEFSFPIPALGHEYPDEWTPTSDGGKQRTCKREGCGYVQKLNSNGELVDPDDPSGPDTDDEDDPDTLYSVRLSSISNGSVVRSVSSAKAGESVTLTAYANAGYELNTVSVRDADGNPVNLTYDGENRYTFKMPSMRVTVYAEFSKAYSSSPTGSGSGASSSSSQGNNSSSSSGSGIPVNRPTPHAAAAGQIYYDVPSNHWASGEIAWAYQSGFMGGTASGAFVPDGRITNQQMWLVLARLTGNHPASMAEARQWAIQNAVAEGANPNVSVTRQQMVIALYRCTALLGRSTASHGSLAGYVDSKTVPNAARNAMTWAITNGIISGTADKRLNPSGTITRAQFAVILYRYYRQIM